MVVLTIARKALSTFMINPAEAPKAITRALEASKDLLNSSARTVAFDKPVPSALMLLDAPPPVPEKAWPMVLPILPNSRFICLIVASAFLAFNSKSTSI